MKSREELNISDQNNLEEDQDLNNYISQLGEKEKIAFEIAKNHLGTSFSLKKSIGYKEWLKINGQKSKDQKKS